MDDLARQLVEAGCFRWEAGMLVHSEANAWDPMWNPGRLCRVEDRESDDVPILADPATAALLAVQAMERGILFEPTSVLGQPCWRWSGTVGPGHSRTDIERTLGEAAARALLAIHPKETP